MMNTAENAAQNDWMEDMLGEFLDESGQLLVRLNENLLQLDALVRSEASDDHLPCDEALLNEMFRSAHSLKGLSGMFGLTDINKLTHRLENVFDAARKEGLPVTGDVVDLMFQAVDHLDKLVEALKDPTAAPVECGTVIDGIHRLLESHGVERKQSSQADAEKALAELTNQAGTAALASEAPPLPTTPVQSGCEISFELDLKLEHDPFAGIEDDAAVADKYIPIFIDEAGLSLDRLAETLLAIDNGGTRESLKTLLHVAHQIKGSAATVGLNRPAKLAHLMEDLLQNLVDSSGVLSPEATDAMLKCTDKLRQYLDNLKKGLAEPDGFGQVAGELLASQASGMPANQALLRHADLAKVDTDTTARQEQTGSLAVFTRQAAEITHQLRRCVEAAAPTGAPCLIGQVRLQPRLPMAGLKGQLVYNKLANLGEVCYFDPPPQQLDEIDVLECVSFGLVSDKPGDFVRESLKIAGVETLTVETLYGGPSGTQDVPAVSCPAGIAEAAPKAVGPRPRTMAASRPAAKQEEPDHTDGAAARGRSLPTDGPRAPTETLRVDIEQLDELMNLSGQLVISKARFAQFGDELKTLRASKRWMQAMTRLLTGLRRLGDDDDVDWDRQSPAAELQTVRRQARRFHSELEGIFEEMKALEEIPDSINDLFEAIHQLDRISDAVQQAAMDTRMVPIGPLFTRFKRVIRDITRANGKEIRLVINGEKTKLDKRMIDELSDPLIHMVRNSADHGIELPDVREAAGKPREGTITLDAFHRGNHVVIQVRDDGAGLNTERILRKCLDKGLFSEADAQKMTPHQIHQMIWAPGLSTAEKVTEVSGRGMGMDIVKSKIDLLHGTVDLQSEAGQGTLLSIKLPLTLAIQPSLLVEIDGDVFAMPMESVVEIVRVPRDKLSTVHGQRTAWVRQRAISVVDLDHVFNWTGRKQRRQADDSGDVTIVIVGETKSELGLEVDCVLGEQDAVIKSITENYRNVTGITGASILGDGRVSLILDVAALIQMAAARTAANTLLEEPT
jgi:two-component system chemotaxis sensor kinase CheA